MTGFAIIHLDEMIKELGEDTVKNILLIGIALEKIKDIQHLGGGKIAYLECEDKPCLTEFYNRHGFVNFGKRDLERDETDLSGTYLIQMLKYF